MGEPGHRSEGGANYTPAKARPGHLFRKSCTFLDTCTFASVCFCFIQESSPRRILGQLAMMNGTHGVVGTANGEILCSLQSAGRNCCAVRQAAPRRDKRVPNAKGRPGKGSRFSRQVSLETVYNRKFPYRRTVNTCSQDSTLRCSFGYIWAVTATARSCRSISEGGGTTDYVRASRYVASGRVNPSMLQ